MGQESIIETISNQLASLGNANDIAAEYLEVMTVVIDLRNYQVFCIQQHCMYTALDHQNAKENRNG
jgi:hypothetical protein